MEFGLQRMFSKISLSISIGEKGNLGHTFR
jgi:hypothetical protein